MTRTEFEHYLTEIHRVLKPNGRLLSWHFLLDTDESPEGVDMGPVVRYDDVSWVTDIRNPAAVVIYDTQYVLAALERAGFIVHARITGKWKKGRSPTGIDDYQDRILSTR